MNFMGYVVMKPSINAWFLQMYNLAYDKAREMLQKNHRVLEKIVEELLEFEMLTGKVWSSLLEFLEVKRNVLLLLN